MFKNNQFTNRYFFLVIISSLLGVILILCINNHFGAGVSPDSVSYLAGARNLIKGDGFLNYDKTPIVDWPPLYPFILALIGKIADKDPTSISNLVNSVIFGLIVFFFGLLSINFLPSFRLFAILSTFSILGSLQLLKITTMSWSEPLFVLLVILSLYFAEIYLRKKDINSLLLLSLFVGLSCITRYIGGGLIFWGCIIIYFSSKSFSKTKIAHLLTFISLSILPIGLWLYRNFIMSNTLLGSRAPTVFTLSHNLTLIFNIILEIILPGEITGYRPILLFAIGAIGVFIGFTIKGNFPYLLHDFQQLIPTVLIISCYTIFLVVSSTTTAYDQINFRLLSPIYLPIILLSIVLINIFAEPYRKIFSKEIINTVIIISLLIWVLLPIRNTIIESFKINSNGQGYTSDVWKNSSTIQFLLSNNDIFSKCTIYTNDPDAVYILTNFVTKISPIKSVYNSPKIVNTISDIKNSWPKESNSCLLWFDATKRDFLFSVEEINTVVRLTPIMHFQDGTVYSVGKN